MRTGCVPRRLRQQPPNYLRQPERRRAVKGGASRREARTLDGAPARRLSLGARSDTGLNQQTLWTSLPVRSCSSFYFCGLARGYSATLATWIGRAGSLSYFSPNNTTSDLRMMVSTPSAAAEASGQEGRHLIGVGKNLNVARRQLKVVLLNRVPHLRQKTQLRALSRIVRPMASTILSKKTVLLKT